MVGAFPPPVHGMAAVNAAMLNLLEEEGESPLVINLAASSLDRSLLARLERMPRILRGLWQLTFQPGLNGSTLYMSLSGGWGQVYELAFLVIARLRRMRVFLHHHSFAYLDHPSHVTRFLALMAGSQAIHITLSPGMAERLRSVYAGIRNVVSISNATFLLNDSSKVAPLRAHLRVLGFLGNIAEEKGIYEFLDVCAATQRQGIKIKAKLAGPFQDSETERAIRHRLDDLPMVEYLGPVYSADKEAFLKSIDLLVFPTRYTNEAEPLVVHEAMMHGVPVIAYGRGAIREIVGKDVGLVIEPTTPFVPAAITQIKDWIDHPESFTQCSHSALERFASSMHENLLHWDALRDELLVDAPNASNHQAQS